MAVPEDKMILRAIRKKRDLAEEVERPCRGGRGSSIINQGWTDPMGAVVYWWAVGGTAPRQHRSIIWTNKNWKLCDSILPTLAIIS
jgi:hypothetical protein